MNKKLGLAVAGAVMAFGASAANAAITIPAGDWTIDIGGNVNAYYTHTKVSGDLDTGSENKTNTVQTGLLPSALGIGGKTRQNDLDIAFQFTFFTGSDSGSGTSLGNNSLNIRQAYLTFGDKSWGTIKGGRDLGIFASDAILSDMTLLGVGVGAGAGGSSTLGRIGSGYMYADWVGQISYMSPNWNGFSFAVGVREPWTNGSDTTKKDMGYEGKVTYEWTGDYAGKVWLGAISQKHQSGTTAASAALDSAGNVVITPASDFDGYTSRGWDIGGKVNVAGFGLVGYYYDGKGLSGSTTTLAGGTALIPNGALFFSNVGKSDDKGGYVQATYVLPGVGTKLGASYGVSKSDPTAGQGVAEFENKSWIVGAYHPLTKSLNLVAEYTDNKLENMGYSAGQDGKAKTVSLGAILFF
ncbi:porin [Methylovorus mays]|uniref:porin n=1 Tax=Methylovorus mays TaxID=184077 RepID=UPI001E5D20C4|nr:porin [Methylovorus mays]MCB5208018.1 porin [Methylovorus mays]